MITQEVLQDYFIYNSETDIFTHKKDSIRRRVGNTAGREMNGYWRIGIKGKEYAAHRLAWLYVYGYWPNNVIDHINGNPLDNRIENLRDVTRTVNANNTTRSKRRDVKDGTLNPVSMEPNLASRLTG